MCNIHLEGYLSCRIKIRYCKKLKLWIGTSGWNALRSQRLLIPESFRKCASFILSHMQIYTIFFCICTWWKWHLLVTSPSASHAVSALERLPSSQGPLSFHFVYYKAVSIKPQGCWRSSRYCLQSQALWKRHPALSSQNWSFYAQLYVKSYTCSSQELR